MWDHGAFRGRSVSVKSRQDRERRKRRRISLRRTEVRIQVLKGFPHRVVESVAARVILNDITPRGVTVFADHGLAIGALVDLVIEQPRRFYVKGRVISSHQANLHQTVLSPNPLPFRVSIAFEFMSSQERETTERYCRDIPWLVAA